ncbi:hypothetical protein MKW92_030810 [Papaver armeniacum]|nr:hypothetical protein MKW92_030810 [Papaver armeniacum]
MYTDWDILSRLTIKDLTATKTMDDPKDFKPEGCDSIPAEVPDLKAKEPDWDDEEDGIWRVAKIPNLAY